METLSRTYLSLLQESSQYVEMDDELKFEIGVILQKNNISPGDFIGDDVFDSLPFVTPRQTKKLFDKTITKHKVIYQRADISLQENDELAHYFGMNYPCMLVIQPHDEKQIDNVIFYASTIGYKYISLQSKKDELVFIHSEWKDNEEASEFWMDLL